MFKNIFLNWNFLNKSILKQGCLFVVRLNFLFFMNLFADFFKCQLYNKTSRKSTENVCEQWDITET